MSNLPSKRIQDWLISQNVNAEILHFDKSVHSVVEAVEVSGFPIERLTKSIVMFTQEGRLVIAMVQAVNRVSTERVRKLLNQDIKPRIATANEVIKYTNQLIGGTTPLNVSNAEILIDPKLLEMDWILTGGGDNRHLVKIAIQELRRIVDFTEVRVRQ